MSDEVRYKRAMDALNPKLSGFDEFIGFGVLKTKHAPSKLAVYVSKPVEALSKEFKSAIPRSVTVNGRKYKTLRTAIINLGKLES
jgi:hypothetical protein